MRFARPFVAFLLALAFAPQAGFAGSEDALSRIREAAAQARKDLEELTSMLDRVEGYETVNDGTVGATVFGGGVAQRPPTLDDMRRSARAVERGAQIISSAAGQCGESARKLARELTSESRKLQSAVARAGSGGETGLMRLRFAIEATGDALGNVSGISSCSGDDSGDDEQEDDQKLGTD